MSTNIGTIPRFAFNGDAAMRDLAAADRAASDYGDAGPAASLGSLACPGAPSSWWLRTQTREEHLAVEADLNLSRLRDLTGLADLLRGWGTVWHEVKCAVSLPQACQQAGDELLVPAGQALAWLKSDLDDLGCPAEEFPLALAHEARSDPTLDCVMNRVGDATCSDHALVDARATDRIRNDAAHLAGLLKRTSASWGVAYVLRGSRLGGAVLARQARAALALQSDRGTKFLASTGTEPGREWLAFRQRLDGCYMPPLELAAAVDAARWTFRWVGTVMATRPIADTRALS